MIASAVPTVWILTDGKAGDEQPLIGLADAMGVTPTVRRVAPRRFFALLMPWGPVDPRDAADKAASPLASPFPDICIATGRRAVPYLRRLKSLSPATFCVLFKDPRTPLHGADLMIVQQHDKPRGDDVLVVVTAPNRLSADRLKEARLRLQPTVAPLPQPRIAVLVGGDSRHHHFTQEDIERLISGLKGKLQSGASLMMTTSRRTPKPLAEALAVLSADPNATLWLGIGDNPLLGYLAWADEIVVTADSTNMVGEAAAIGVPVQVFHPSGGHGKIDRFLQAISQEAAIGIFPEAPTVARKPPLNSTPELAHAVLARWHAFKAARDPSS